MTLTAFNRRRRELAAQAEAAREEAEKPTPVVTETAPAEKPLSRMNKAELLAAAAERGVEVVETATKKEIIAALTAAETADEQQDDTQQPGDENDGSDDQSETAENETE